MVSVRRTPVGELRAGGARLDPVAEPLPGAAQSDTACRLVIGIQFWFFRRLGESEAMGCCRCAGEVFSSVGR